MNERLRRMRAGYGPEAKLELLADAMRQAGDPSAAEEVTVIPCWCGDSVFVTPLDPHRRHCSAACRDAEAAAERRRDKELQRKIELERYEAAMRQMTHLYLETVGHYARAVCGAREPLEYHVDGATHMATMTRDRSDVNCAVCLSAQDEAGREGIR